MPVELGLWRIDPSLRKIELGGFDLEERLEEILNADISMVSPNWMVIGRQVRTGSDKFVDLLCIDRDGNLVIVELKRKSMERQIIAQILDYGSWVSTLNEDDIIRIFEACRKKYHSSQPAVPIDKAFRTHFEVVPLSETRSSIKPSRSLGLGIRYVGRKSAECPNTPHCPLARVTRDDKRCVIERTS